jgi:hypothetical protein
MKPEPPNTVTRRSFVISVIPGWRGRSLGRGKPGELLEIYSRRRRAVAEIRIDKPRQTL